MSATVRELRLVLKARAQGLDEPTVRLLVDHVGDRPADEARAYALAVLVRDLGCSSLTLAQLLESSITPDQVVGRAARLCSPTWRLPKTAEVVLRGTVRF